MTMSAYYSSPSYATVTLRRSGSGTTGGFVKLNDIDKDGVSIVVAVYPTTNVMRADAALLGLGSMYYNLRHAS